LYLHKKIGTHEEQYVQNLYMYTNLDSVLTKTKLNLITFLKFLELIGKVYKMEEVQSTNCDCTYCPSYYPKNLII